MRILVINYEYPPLGGGSSPVTAALCHELVRLGNKVDVVTMAFKGLPVVENHSGLRVFRVPCVRTARHICYVHELLTYVASGLVKALQLMRWNSYSLVHAHFVLPSGLITYCLHMITGIPYVITAHGSDVQSYNPDRFRRLHRVLAPVWRRIVRNASAVTSPSRSLAELIQRNYGSPLSLKIIPNGIRADRIPQGTKDESILVVSRLLPRKNVHCLLQALEGCELGYRVHIIGDGPSRSSLQHMATAVRDPVVFHGWLDNDSGELLELYRRCSIFVFPSRAENFPVSLLEAMLCGAAIIATNIEGCVEVLGNAARFVPPNDPAAIQQELLNLTGDQRARTELGTRARRRVLEMYSWGRLGKQYLDLFSALGRPSKE